MIYFFSGTPGSGKSLDMARCILNDLRFGRPVICNFDVKLPKRFKGKKDLLHCMDNESITVPFLRQFASDYYQKHNFKEGAITLYLDECQLLFNARTWALKGRADWNKFFTNHRHLGYNIILAAQFDRMIDRQIRSLFEYEVIHRKVNSMGWKGLFFRVLFLSPTLFLRLTYYYPLREKLHVEFYRYNRRWASIYDSYSTDFVDMDLKEEKEIENIIGSVSAAGGKGHGSPKPPAHETNIDTLQTALLLQKYYQSKDAI